MATITMTTAPTPTSNSSLQAYFKPHHICFDLYLGQVKPLNAKTLHPCNNAQKSFLFKYSLRKNTDA